MKRHHHKHDASKAEHVEHKHAESAPAVADDVLAKGLEIIYGEDRDDLHVVEKGGSVITRWLLRIIGVLAALTAMAFTSFYVYTTYLSGETSVEPLVMTFETATTVASGERATVVLHYADPTSVPLASLEIDVNLPTTFRLLTADPIPTNAEELVWDLGTIPANSDGKITLEGVWIAEVPSSTALQALANYKPANFNSYFHDIVATTITTSTSVASVTLAGPETASPGAASTYTATVMNAGTETMTNVELAASLPQGFFVTSTTPTIEGGSGTVWQIGDLAPGSTATYAFTGTFASDVSGIMTVGVALGIQDDSRTIAQSSSSVFTDVTGSDVQLDMVVNGGTTNVTADPGSVLRASLRIQNTGDEPLAGVTALLDFQSEGSLPIVWGEASLDGGRVTAAGILYDAAAIGELAAGERALINLSLPLKDDLSTASSVFSLVLSATSAGVTVQASPIEVLLNSDASFATEARYFDEDGAPLGSGPLPPTVGQTTSYRVRWTVTNGLHDLEDVTVSTTLPADVTWDNFASADLGSVAYDSSTRTVRWSITTMPDDVQQVQANFSLSVTPTQDDVGTYMKLTTGSILRAQDVETSASLERQSDELTTELPLDALASGKGIVAID